MHETAAYANHRLRLILGVESILHGATFDDVGARYVTFVDGKQTSFDWQMAQDGFRIPFQFLCTGNQRKMHRPILARILCAVRRIARFLKQEADAEAKRYGRPVRFAFLTKDVLDFASETQLDSRDWLCCLEMYYTLVPISTPKN